MTYPKSIPCPNGHTAYLTVCDVRMPDSRIMSRTEKRGKLLPGMLKTDVPCYACAECEFIEEAAEVQR